MQASRFRPRVLHWFQAGPMLFGDWGTSRLYVLGLALAFNGRAAPWFVAAMCVLMVGVGWSYEVICRLFPDGGGVYSSARHRSQLLAVVGGLLLCADYVVTASLSCLDAFHYLDALTGLGGIDVLGLPIEAVLAAGTIGLIGALNAFGPSKSGTAAMVVALVTVALTLVIGGAALLHMTGLRPVAEAGAVDVASPWSRGGWASWVGFTEIVLALSGVEAVANMTGIMVRPVAKTARRAIVPVLLEIVALNLLLSLAMVALPDIILYRGGPEAPVPAHTDDMLKVIAAVYVGPLFAAVSSLVFALLLLSAVNTALADLVSIQFMMSRDRELPRAFAALNRYGMPMVPLAVGAVVPVLVVLLFPDVTALAGLYAIGVVGAIAINLGTTSTNRDLPLRPFERRMMQALTLVMIVIGLTICAVKPHARSFALLVLVTGLSARLATIVTGTAAGTIPGRTVAVLLAVAAAAIAGEFATAIAWGDGLGPFLVSLTIAAAVLTASAHVGRYRAEVAAAPAAMEGVPPPPMPVQPGTYTPKERIMVATRGGSGLLDYAIRMCRDRRAELIVLYVRHLSVIPMGPFAHQTLDEDVEARTMLDGARRKALAEGVPCRLLYAVAESVPEVILDMAATHGADQLLLGVSRRGALWKAMKGDVIAGVAEQLPEGIDLLIRA